MSVPPLPWTARAPYEGCDGERLGWSVWDADGDLVLEMALADDDAAHAQAVAICVAMNRAGPAVCAYCDNAPATCFGFYEDDLSPCYACDECCGHGGEDGSCEPLTAAHAAGRAERDAEVAELRAALAEACDVASALSRHTSDYDDDITRLRAVLARVT